VPLAAHGRPLLDPRRGDDALTWALDRGILGPDDVREPVEIDWSDAARIHDPAYLATLDQPEALARVLGTDATRRIPVAGLLEMWRRACGGVLAAARWARAHDGIGLCTMGGFHHAEPSKGGGFCALNDLAIAVARLRADGHRGQIVTIDLDAHPPDGTVACLGDDEDVYVLSVSVDSHWSVPEGPRVIDRRVPADCEDEPYLVEVDRLLAEIHHRPTLALYLAGTDPLRGDPLGGLGVSEEGLRERDHRVFRALRGVPTVAVPAGGYTDRAWRVLAGTIAEATGSGATVHPDYDPLQRRTRYLASRLDVSVLRGEDADRIDDAELMAELGLAPPRPDRFLDFYTRHGVEHALSHYGLLPALRAMGFADLKVEISRSDDRHRLQMTAAHAAGRTDLIDLCLSRRDMAGGRVLFIEWLEMRDPRLTYTAGRPELPGQRGPGLGLAPEVGHLLFATARRLQLDGIGLIPAHFHVAWMARHRFVVVDPQLRGRFEALCEMPLPLSKLSRVLGGEGLSTPEGPIRWKPTEMVCPVSERCDKALAAGARQAEAAYEATRERLGLIG